MALDPKFLPYVDLTDDDSPEDAPQLSLEFKPCNKDGTFLSLTLPYRIEFILRRLDKHSKPIIFRWSPALDFKRCRFVLLHETDSSLQKVAVPKLWPTKNKDEEDILQFTGHESYIRSLSPVSDFSQVWALAGNYQKALVPGEKYHLFWPGAEVDMWEWGTKPNWQGRGLKSLLVRGTKLPKLVLPASNALSFTARQEDEPWPERAELERGTNFEWLNFRELQWRANRRPPPPPIGQDARVLGAPIFTMTVQGPSQLNLTDHLYIKTIVTYDGNNNPQENAKAVTFHPEIFTA